MDAKVFIMLDILDKNILEIFKEFNSNGLNRKDIIVYYHAKFNKKLPRTTLYERLEKMEKMGILERFPLHQIRQGRPIVLWDINRYLPDDLPIKIKKLL